MDRKELVGARKGVYKVLEQKLLIENRFFHGEVPISGILSYIYFISHI